jgi:hypothetical protein
MNDFGQTVDLPDDFKSALINAYDEDFSSYDAKVSGLENQLVEKDNAIKQTITDYDKQISSLKAVNYDLMRAVPKDAKSSKSDDGEDNLPDHDITIADLFTKKK